jgi:hypothetical protein
MTATPPTDAGTPPQEAGPSPVLPHVSHSAGGLDQFLLAEFEHVGNSFLQSEQDGESRVQFFLALATAVLGGIGFLLDADDQSPTQLLMRGRSLVIGALTILLLLGYFSFRRLIQRNIASDRYKFALRAIRRHFVAPAVAQSMVNVFPGLYDANEPTPRSAWPRRRIGWIHVMAIANGLLVGALVVVALLGRSVVNLAGSFAIAGASALIALVLLLHGAQHRYEREWKSLMTADTKNREAATNRRGRIAADDATDVLTSDTT